MEISSDTQNNKKIIICCDGTWNQPEKKIDDNGYKPTNVLKLMRTLRARDKKGRHQVVYYDSGVGTDRGLYDKYIGGAFGLGLSSHIKKAYRFIANNFEEGDELYCFGFSRGAYTVRALGGMIGAVGLLRPRYMHRLPEAFAYYHTQPDKRAKTKFYDLLKNEKLETRKIAIKFMGAWDTVGALGVPIPLLKWVSRWRVGFFNPELGDHIQFAYHALAIDERRRPFAPNLWTSLEKKTEGHIGTQDICQVWFPGVHSNIGGGYPDAGLSDEAFHWMIKRAEDCGLAFDSRYLHKVLDPNPLGNLEESFSWVYKALCFLGVWPYTRPIGPNPKLHPIQKWPHDSWIWRPLSWFGIQPYKPGINEMIHESALKRFTADPSSYQQHHYTPKNLKEALDRLPVFREEEYPKHKYHRFVA